MVMLSTSIFEVVDIDLQFGSNEFHQRIVDGKNDLQNVSKRHLGTLYCKEFVLRLLLLSTSPLEDDMHYLLECPLYANERMQLFINITLHTVISIENVLLGSDNLTDENNLAVFRNV
jgi:hypothetical protein